MKVDKETPNRPYNKNPKQKLEKGEHWEFPFVPLPEVAKKLVAESEKTGGSYRKIINDRLIKSYGIKPKKK